MYKSIKDYEGFYEVNELGQVRSVDRTVEFKDGRIRKFNGIDLKLSMNKGGYLLATLKKNGVSKNCQVHRLVADTFLPNPDNLPEVHHKNHERKDNRACNLQWITSTEQKDEHWRAARSKAKTKGTRLRVIGNGIDKIYNSSREVERELGVSNTSAMKVAKGIYKQTKGYKIHFVDATVARNA